MLDFAAGATVVVPGAGALGALETGGLVVEGAGENEPCC
jgi:hypothetical protein